jgi:uncharacterized protein YqfA (UPF0365 family)
MKKHTKKLIAPIVITIVLSAYLIAWAVMWSQIPVALWIKILCAAVPLALVGVCGFVLAERIKEVRSGEEDDLGNY